MPKRKKDKFRKVWSEEAAPPEQPQSALPTPPETPDPEPAAESGRSALDTISAVKTKSRRYEKRNPSFTFRGVPQSLDQRIKEIAEELRVLKDEVAQAFLEYSLDLYEKQELPLEPRLAHSGRSRRTLYPEGRRGGKWGGRTGQHLENTTKKPAGETESEKNPRSWESVVGYRIPRELKDGIAEIARTDRRDATAITQGDVVTKFLERAEKDYAKKILVLNPVEQ